MRLAVGIKVKNHILPTAREPRFAFVRAAHAALDRVQPWPNSNTTEAQQWVPPVGRTAIIFRSNEPQSTEERRGWVGNKQRSWAWTGVTSQSVVQSLRSGFAGKHGMDEAVWDGVGSFATIGATPDTLVAYTNAHRSEALYYVDLPDAVVISNSAAVLSLMAGQGTVRFSHLGLAGFLMHGLPLSETIPFEGVSLVPAGAKLHSSPEADIALNLDSGDRAFGQRPYEDRVESLGASLVAYASTLAKDVKSIRAAATGGKDSRLVLAALTAAGVDFTAYTNGLPESGEVHIGRRVTEHLGVPQRINQPKTTRTREGNEIVIADPETQAWQTLRSTGGLGNAFTILPNPSQSYVSPLTTANFGGQGGEIIRGGFLRYLKAEDPTPSNSLAIMLKYWTNNADLLNPLAYEAVLADYAPILDMRWTDPGRPLFEGYITNRTGRWLATMRHGESVVYPHTTLLIDNQLVRRLKSFSTDEMRGEKVAHSVMRKLAPGLQDIPFFRDRWTFEQDGPSDFYAPDSWHEREPHTAHAQPRADFNWRNVYSKDLSGFIREFVLDSPRSMLFDIINRSAVETMLNGKGYRPPAAWALFSTQYALAQDWLSPWAPSSTKTIGIPVPKR